MLSLEIKVNDRIVEVITAINIGSAHMGDCVSSNCLFMHKYLVNGVIEIEHVRIDGHRELARKMLQAVKEFKK